MQIGLLEADFPLVFLVVWLGLPFEGAIAEPRILEGAVQARSVAEAEAVDYGHHNHAVRLRCLLRRWTRLDGMARKAFRRE